MKYHFGYFAFKRIFDVFSSLAAIIVLLPFLPFIALLIRIDSRGPIFFRQKRLGLGGREFWIYKLRTMTDKAPEIRNPDGSQFVGEHDPRLTRVGKWLRASSVDELPQILNVLKGDMSVVGPRPDVRGPVDLDSELFQKKRSLRPGLASLASLQGRNAIPWMERVRWDVYYVENACFRLDMEILFKTVRLVIRREGVYYPESSREPDKSPTV